MIEDPQETEQWIALNAYLCFCSAWGCFLGVTQAYWRLGVYIDNVFWMGAAFALAGAILLILADFRVPTILVTRTLRKAVKRTTV